MTLYTRPVLETSAVSPAPQTAPSATLSLEVPLHTLTHVLSDPECLKPQKDGLGRLPSHKARMGVGPPSGAARPPGGGNLASASTSCRMLLQSRPEPGYPGRNRLFHWGTHLRSGARTGRVQREKRMDRGADRSRKETQLRHSSRNIPCCPSQEVAALSWHSTGMQSLVQSCVLP